MPGQRVKLIRRTAIFAAITDRSKGNYLLVLLLESAMLGVFMVRGWALFYVFCELTLIPLFFLIDRWGGKNRRGAFREDRYHATAIESGEHLPRCLVYIDLNMARNCVVMHPSEWRHGGYNEMQDPPLRYALLNREKLIKICGFDTDE